MSSIRWCFHYTAKWSKYSDKNILDTKWPWLFLQMVCVKVCQVADSTMMWWTNYTHRLLHFVLLSVLLYSGQSSGGWQANWEFADQNTEMDEEYCKFYPKLAEQRKQRKSCCCACKKEGRKSTSEIEELHAYIWKRTSLSLTKKPCHWLLICILLIT